MRESARRHRPPSYRQRDCSVLARRRAVRRCRPTGDRPVRLSRGFRAVSTADLPGERWRPIAGHEDAYEVSDFGRVRSLAREIEVSHPTGSRVCKIQERILKPFMRGGYPGVAFGRGTTRRDIAPLVAEAFIGPRPAGHLVMHKDGCRTNAALSNLVYATQLEAEAGKQRRGTTSRGEHRPAAKLTEEDVVSIRTNPDKLSTKELAARYGVWPVHISALARGAAWKHVPMPKRRELT